MMVPHDSANRADYCDDDRVVVALSCSSSTPVAHEPRTVATQPEIVPLTSYEVNDTFVGRAATEADLLGGLQKRGRRVR